MTPPHAGQVSVIEKAPAVVFDEAVYEFLENTYWRILDNPHSAAKEGSIKVHYCNDLDAPW